MKNSKLSNIKKGTIIQRQLGSSEKYKVIGDNGKLNKHIAVMPLQKEFLFGRFNNPTISYFSLDTTFYYN